MHVIVNARAHLLDLIGFCFHFRDDEASSAPPHLFPLNEIKEDNSLKIFQEVAHEGQLALKNEVYAIRSQLAVADARVAGRFSYPFPWCNSIFHLMISYFYFIPSPRITNPDPLCGCSYYHGSSQCPGRNYCCLAARHP